LDNQIIIDYATFIFSQNEETICKIFPSQNIIKRNAIIKVRVRKITNSIEKVLVLFKTITTESLLIYSFIIVLCTCCDFFEENDINLFLQALPSDLLCIRKYLTMIISVIYRIAISKWEEMKQNNSTLKDVTSEVESLKDTTTEVVKETLEIKSTINTVETTSSQAINKANTAINKVESVESEVNEVKSVINETTSKVETVESEVNEVKTVINETTSKVDSNIIAINNITQEIEILKTSTPTLDCVTKEHADEFFAECFGK
jgi:uncharacterized phage infection (PIP) family protein YhgE